MVTTLLRGTRIDEWGGKFRVKHPLYDIALAYCDTEQEARPVVASLDAVAMAHWRGCWTAQRGVRG
ncbi:MAG TPA: hypothetical protein VMT97_09875 [Terriglobales bacterium]|nr:hypothetical protein [Terriglobales bacterium]